MAILIGATAHAGQHQLAAPAALFPALKLVENIGLCLQQNQLSNRVRESDETIVDACNTGWIALIANGS